VRGLFVLVDDAIGAAMLRSVPRGRGAILHAPPRAGLFRSDARCGHFSLLLTYITNAAASVGFSSCAAAIGRTFAGSALEKAPRVWAAFYVSATGGASMRPLIAIRAGLVAFALIVVGLAAAAYAESVQSASMCSRLGSSLAAPPAAAP
jgi:hypothetical protein